MEQLKNYLQASKARKEIPARDETQIGNRLHEVFDRMVFQSGMKADPPRLATGIEDVDEIIGGLELGELVAINGLPGSGRTAIALELALQTAKDTQVPILICSQRHSAQQLTCRLLSMLTGVAISAIEKAEMDDAQWNALYSASAWLKDQDICIFEIDRHLPELCATLRRRNTPALVIIDGLPDEQIWRESMQMLKTLASETTCCVVFTGFHPDTTVYIAGGVDKVFHLDWFAERENTLEIKWNRTGKNACALLLWHAECLQFLAYPATDHGGNG